MDAGYAGRTAAARSRGLVRGPVTTARPGPGPALQLQPTYMKHIRVASALLLLSGAALAPLPAQTLGGCAMFPANNIWNTPIDTLPVSSFSAAYINSIGPSTGLHPDFGSGTWDGEPIGIPYALVPGSQPKVAVTFDYADQSDPGPYPIPANPPIEGGADSTGDRHILLADSTNCILYELYAAYPQPDGTWQAGSGAIFDLKGNQLRPQGWTSADAAGLPILPGLVRHGADDAEGVPLARPPLCLQ